VRNTSLPYDCHPGRDQGGEGSQKRAEAFALTGYSYQVIATNILKGSPEKVWRFYNGRANIENMIKEAALGIRLGRQSFPCYAGNMAYFQISMLAYNLAELVPDPCQKRLKMSEKDPKPVHQIIG